MITEHDLQEAILECQGTRNPTATTCIKLAAFLIIKRELYPDQEPEPFKEPPQVYSYSKEPISEPPEEITYDSGSEFSEAISGKHQEDVWPVIDELMDVLHTINPRLYDGVMRKLDQ